MVLSKTQKQELVTKLQNKIKGVKVVAIASLQNLPSRQLNLIRKKLRGKAEFLITRSTLLQKTLESRSDLKQIPDHFKGSVAIILTDLDPFKLYALIKAAKSKASAKAGDIAPEDIIVPAGETNLPPGPVLSELKAAKIDARIQGPKITIGKDCKVATKGQPIKPEVAKVLTILGIEPMEISLRILLVKDETMTYAPEVLDVDQEQYKKLLVDGHQRAINLAVYATIFNKESIVIMIQKAARGAAALEKAKPA